MAKKSTIHVDIEKDVTELDKILFEKLIYGVRKVSLNNKKHLAVYVSFSAKGEVSIVTFGAVPETKVKAQWLADKIADMIPVWIEAYDIPQIDLPDKPAIS